MLNKYYNILMMLINYISIVIYNKNSIKKSIFIFRCPNQD